MSEQLSSAPNTFSGGFLSAGIWPLLRHGHRPLTGTRRKVASVDGHRVVWLERGRATPERPTIVMVHGFAAMKENWAYWLRMLPNDWHLIAIDLPGFGETTYRAGMDYSYEAQAGRLLTWLDQRNWEKVHLVGSSMGGAIVTIAGARAPDRIASVSVLNSAGVPAQRPSALDQMLDQGEYGLVPRRWKEVWRMFTMVGTGGPSLTGAAMALALGPDLLRRQQAHSHIFRDMLRDRDAVARYLPDYPVPLLVLWGDRDHLTEVSCVDTYRQLAPAPKIEVFRGVGHLPMLEIPRRSARALETFIREQPKG
ncbi:alpha/beta fold hydrolase [Mangrovitalea sediminis]|uniref:alpha/beta fold hydrolase n=1 Tax=Mangrovitalea sediminis TaxID=1982043 RepID=UPI000BE5A870|nr:alpha/beta fold hydrolase [Mangrovitalea sediminis]